MNTLTIIIIAVVGITLGYWLARLRQPALRQKLRQGKGFGGQAHQQEGNIIFGQAKKKQENPD